jgi:hypothetical protein
MDLSHRKSSTDRIRRNRQLPEVTVPLTADRPKPLLDAARIWALVAGGIGAVLTFAVSNGVLSSAQADAVNTGSASVNVLFSALLAVVSAGSGIFGAFGTAKHAQKDVTPITSPALVVDSELVPLIPATPTAPLTAGGL